MFALLLLTPKPTRLLNVSTRNIAPVGSSKCRRARGLLLGSLSHPMGKGAGVSQHGPIEHRAARAGTSLPVVQDAGVLGSVSLQTSHGGPCVALEAKVCAANALCEGCSWGV